VFDVPAEIIAAVYTKMTPGEDMFSAKASG
jgi:hypothetical protein